MSDLDLIVLRLERNVCLARLFSLKEIRRDSEALESDPHRYQDFSADINRGVWFFRGRMHKIGKGDFTHAGSYDIIGVYDRTNVGDMNQMLSDYDKVTKGVEV